MEKVCPRCKLPQEGIDECEYCGLVFNNYKADSNPYLRRIAIVIGFVLAVIFLAVALLK